MDLKESRFTPPREFCKHPEYWHSPDAEATEIEVSEFIGALIRVLQPEYAVETGTYSGHTATQIALALHKNGHGTLDTVEANQSFHKKAIAYFENTLAAKTLIENEGWSQDDVEDARSRINFINGNTMSFVPQGPIDFAFFDSWQEGRHQEFLRYKELGCLQPGAIVAFHDTAPHHQVLKHILKLELDDHIKALYFRTPRGVAIAEVK